ncbi:MAG: SteA C-terminal domain-containing protein [Microthrixaceae bacterium]
MVEGTSEGAAMLLAYECRAELIVAVGTHATMVEFLDKGRAGMSSTFLTRLRIGPMLIDAKGVSRLYKGRVRRRDILMLVVAALVVIAAVGIVSDSLQVLLRAVWVDLRDIWYSITGRFS